MKESSFHFPFQVEGIQTHIRGNYANHTRMDHPGKRRCLPFLYFRNWDMADKNPKYMRQDGVWFLHSQGSWRASIFSQDCFCILWCSHQINKLRHGDKIAPCSPDTYNNRLSPLFILLPPRLLDSWLKSSIASEDSVFSWKVAEGGTESIPPTSSWVL